MRFLMSQFMIIFAAFFVLLPPVMAADVPSTLTYKGTLTDSTGQPVTGQKSITLSLYTTLTEETPFWTETQDVTVTNGQFSAVLGADSGNPLDKSKFTGETYIGIKVDAGTEMLPRQKLTSVAYALIAGNALDVNNAIPSGVIVMWSGSIDSIPEGWALCDGNNGTPDLRDRFILGTSEGEKPGGTERWSLHRL